MKKVYRVQVYKKLQISQKISYMLLPNAVNYPKKFKSKKVRRSWNKSSVKHKQGLWFPK